MSIAVDLADLESTLEPYPWGYLVTVTDDGRTHCLAVPTQLVDGVFAASAGRGTLANVAARPNVTMPFPPTAGTGYSVIVDGTARAFDDHVEISPTKAVQHRPAL